LTALMVTALYWDIASRICVPLSKADKKPTFRAEHELWVARAMADDLNRNRNTLDAFPEALLVR
jgi:hypothetical protein